MPTEINSHRTLAHAIAPHEQGTFLALVRVTDSDGEAAVYAIEVVRDRKLGDLVSGDVGGLLEAMQLALTLPSGGDLVIFQAEEDEWSAWMWNLLAGSTIPVEAQKAQEFISGDLNLVLVSGEGEIHIRCHNAYPIVLLS